MIGGTFLIEYICGAYDRLSDADNKTEESSSIQSQKMILDSFAKFNNLKIYKYFLINVRNQLFCSITAFFSVILKR